MIADKEVGCKICEKSIYRIFVEHIAQHLKEMTDNCPDGCSEIQDQIFKEKLKRRKK